MTKKIIIASITMILLLSIRAFTQPNAWNYLNFECGGHVTEIIPVKYPTGHQPPSIDQQVLYARTDIGGIYRSSNNGVSWEFASNYYKVIGNPGITESELSIQGVSVRHDVTSNKQVLVVAWGNEESDAIQQGYQSIWRSENNGTNWAVPTPTVYGPYGVWFQGNNFPVKIGGQCITYDPNNIDNINPPHINESWMYMGGFGPNDGITHLYKSENDGVIWDLDLGFENFIQIQSNQIPKEGIICISIKEGNTDHIWIGTTHRIIYTTNAGVSWNSVNIPTVEKPFVKRIILKKEGSDITGAMVVWGDNNGSAGIGRLMASNNWTYEPLNSFSTEKDDMFSALAFVDDNEDIIIAGQIFNPLRTTSDFGSTWSSNEIQLEYTYEYSPGDPNYHNFPNHQDSDELLEHMFDGLSCITKNPNPNWGEQWYLSGGAGGRKTAPNHGVSGNDFANSGWQYTVKGQSMPVMYDVVFHNLNYNSTDKPVIYMPMSDWTMSWEYTENITFSSSGMLVPTPFKYDRHLTEMCNYDTYISNVTRILFNPDDPNLAYCVGGSVYDYTQAPVSNECKEKHYAGFYKRRDVNGSGNNFIIERRENSPFLNIPERAIIDAIMYKTPGNVNRIIALVGEYDDQLPPNGTDIGVFYSDNGGDSWYLGSFNLASTDPNAPTYEAYMGSKIPSLVKESINGTVGALFDGHFSLSQGGNNTVCLWLEEGSDHNTTGGIFLSLNNGQNWSRSNAPDELIPLTHYYGPGSIKWLSGYEIALAVRKGSSNNAGLYKGTINYEIGDITWENEGNSLYNFISAEHVDYLDGKWAVFGKKSGDAYNQVYVSSNNGDTWERIPKDGNSLPYFPKVHSLRIRPEPNDNELWVATRGQGVWIYNGLVKSENEKESISMMMYLKYIFDMVSNFF